MTVKVMEMLMMVIAIVVIIVKTLVFVIVETTMLVIVRVLMLVTVKATRTPARKGGGKKDYMPPTKTSRTEGLGPATTPAEFSPAGLTSS